MTVSSDWVVLSVSEQNEKVVIGALQEVVHAVDVRAPADGHFLELLDDQGIVLLVIERPKLIRSPAELARLHPGADISAPSGSEGIPDLFTLDPASADSGPSPVWWLDLHASSNVPRTDHLADALAHAVARRTRGVVIAPRTVSEPPRMEHTP